jgi:hypothetical protein
MWFYPGTRVSATNKTDRHDIAEILLKVVLNTINLSLTIYISAFVVEGELFSSCFQLMTKDKG